mgnify:CR=1 FL=1
MNDRFKFRATFSVSYYDENGNDKDIKLTVYDVAVYSGGEIGFSAQQMETIINALELPEIEEDTMWQFINDNYATSSYEWFVCDNAIIEQCTGLKDKNGNLIYEGDIIQNYNKDQYVVEWCIDGYWHIRQVDDEKFGCALASIKTLYDGWEIIGNIHEQAEQKDVK